ncbi:MAG: hypothetical protein FVQ82_04635 [Planctomycetes bacterium]|nr:hypothetical protein [Planctomycetota bacterium]
MRTDNLIKDYRQSRIGQKDYQLTNTVVLASDLLFKLATGFYGPEQEGTIWEMVERLITQYAENKHKEGEN